MHSENEASAVKSTGNIKENLEKSSEVAPLDGIDCNYMITYYNELI